MIHRRGGGAGRGLALCGVVLAVLVAGSSMVVPSGASHAVLWRALIGTYLLIAGALAAPLTLRATLPTAVWAEPLFLIFFYLVLFLPCQLHLAGLLPLESSRFFVGDGFLGRANQAVLLALSGAIALASGARLRRSSAVQGVRLQTARTTVIDRVTTETTIGPVARAMHGVCDR